MRFGRLCGLVDAGVRHDQRRRFSASCRRSSIRWTADSSSPATMSPGRISPASTRPWWCRRAGSAGDGDGCRVRRSNVTRVRRRVVRVLSRRSGRPDRNSRAPEDRARALLPVARPYGRAPAAQSSQDGLVTAAWRSSRPRPAQPSTRERRIHAAGPRLPASGIRHPQPDHQYDRGCRSPAATLRHPPAAHDFPPQDTRVLSQTFAGIWRRRTAAAASPSCTRPSASGHEPVRRGADKSGGRPRCEPGPPPAGWRPCPPRPTPARRSSSRPARCSCSRWTASSSRPRCP